MFISCSEVRLFLLKHFQLMCQMFPFLSIALHILLECMEHSFLCFLVLSVLGNCSVQPGSNLEGDGDVMLVTGAMELKHHGMHSENIGKP